MYVIPRLQENYYRVLFIASSILLILALRMVFPLAFSSVPAYEPDAINYMNTVNTWVTSGIDLGVVGAYQHNFPMSFMVAFAFVKLGVPLDAFYRIAPFVIYAINMILLYLIIEELMPENQKKTAIPALSIFLFSFSSLGYWVTVHYSPDLFGTLMFFVCLYLGIKFAKAGNWTFKAMLPLGLSIFILILSHHLSTLYLIITFFGFSLSSWFFKSSQFKRGTLTFFILAIYTYTLWFAYGTLVYPSFFNVYIYFSGFSDVPQQVSSAGWINNLTFTIYPIFIVSLFLIEFLKIIHVERPNSSIKNYVLSKLKEISLRESGNNIFTFSMGFILIFLLFIIGFAVPVLLGTRILEVLLIGMYPLASISLYKFEKNNSRRTKIILYLLILAVVLTSIYRYYSQIQRRVILG
jgi:hypothetical protein